jgi:hypothetical protein
MLTLDMPDSLRLQREVARKADEGDDELRLMSEKEERKQAAI